MEGKSLFFFCGFIFESFSCCFLLTFMLNCLVDCPSSLFFSRHLQRRRRRPRTSPRLRLSQPHLRLRPPQPPHPRNSSNTMMQETTGVKTVTSPLVPCLIFSHTYTAKCTERLWTHMTGPGPPHRPKSPRPCHRRRSRPNRPKVQLSLDLSILMKTELTK